MIHEDLPFLKMVIVHKLAMLNIVKLRVRPGNDCSSLWLSDDSWHGSSAAV